jgi:hypothetical protein
MDIAHAFHFLMRLVLSLVLPAWGLIMLGLGIAYGSWWWILTGLATLGVGAVGFVGNPLFNFHVGER